VKAKRRIGFEIEKRSKERSQWVVYANERIEAKK